MQSHIFAKTDKKIQNILKILRNAIVILQDFLYNGRSGDFNLNILKGTLRK